MKTIRLKNISDYYFDKAWELYEDAFPIEEKKTLDEQIVDLQNDDYHFDVIIEKDQFVGFNLWWNFEAYNYIEYFATSAQHRNKGIGKLVLEKFIDTNNKQIILEVELPISNINERRINFYKRIGFKLNEHYYEIPSLRKSKSPLQLLLMSYPGFISKKDVDFFIHKYHPIIYNKTTK
ncbi:GNAT family N-acetyltransferase [Lutibacter sp. A80]|uniref:GNAT family N-acetyltransferase n=1 Tax=Lutibacter sp. A80 TaxID=2918453 RepID=UPI001F0628F6|nr:GNAT family N-acetyltransferase [Lutibacter sp. A80]UMB61150.1 GNAT family N-acetyltransferase [Lutibacter sp. A80]